MRDVDLMVLEKAYDALALYLPKQKSGFLDEFFDTYVYLSNKLEKKKAYYAKNAQYYRDKVKKWKKDNPEQMKKHQSDYQARKRKEMRYD